jgi:hypothetical protein
MADTSPGRATRTLVDRLDCGNTAICVPPKSCVRSRYGTRACKEALELSYVVKRLTEKRSMSNRFVILHFCVANGDTGISSSDGKKTGGSGRGVRSQRTKSEAHTSGPEGRYLAGLMYGLKPVPTSPYLLFVPAGPGPTPKCGEIKRQHCYPRTRQSSTHRAPVIPRNFPTPRDDAPNACLTLTKDRSRAFPVASPAVEMAVSVFWLLTTSASMVESPAAIVDCAGRFAGLTQAISD